MTLDEVKSLLEVRTRAYDSLLERYGTGVRPAWVGEELSHHGAGIRACLAEIERLENEEEDNG